MTDREGRFGASLRGFSSCSLKARPSGEGEARGRLVRGATANRTWWLVSTHHRFPGRTKIAHGRTMRHFGAVSTSSSVERGVVRRSERIGHCSTRCSVGVWALSDLRVADQPKRVHPRRALPVLGSRATTVVTAFGARLGVGRTLGCGDVEIVLDSSVTRSAGSVVHEGVGSGRALRCPASAASTEPALLHGWVRFRGERIASGRVPRVLACQHADHIGRRAMNPGRQRAATCLRPNPWRKPSRRWENARAERDRSGGTGRPKEASASGSGHVWDVGGGAIREHPDERIESTARRAGASTRSRAV